MGLDDRTIRRWLTDVPGYREHIDSLRGSLTEENATDVLLDLLHSTDERVRLAAARELRRAPNPNPKPEDEDADALAAWA